MKQIYNCTDTRGGMSAFTDGEWKIRAGRKLPMCKRIEDGARNGLSAWLQIKRGSRDGGREVRSARWRKRERRAGQQQQQRRRRRIKTCGEVMAVMNSPCLISGNQVGVWRLDFNTGLWLHSACKVITGRKKNSKLEIISYFKTDFASLPLMRRTHPTCHV